MRCDRACGSILALIVLCACGTARAQQTRDGVRVHAIVGPVLLRSAQDVGAGDAATATGLGLGAELFLGAGLSESLVLGMNLWVARSEGASHSLLEDTALTAIFAGASAGYQAVPRLLLLRAGLGLFRSSIEGAPVRVEIEIPQTDSSDIGVGLLLGAALDFALGDAFGLGAGLSLVGASASNDDAGTDAARYVLGVLLGVHASVR